MRSTAGDETDGAAPVQRSDALLWAWPDTARSVAAVVLLVGGGLIAKGDIPGVERSLFLAVNGLPDQLYWPLWVPMQLGSIGGCIGLAALLGWATKRWSLGLIASSAVFTAWIAAKAVKGAIGRGRPMDEGIETILHEHLRGGLGFVSGHAALVFALFAVAAPHLRRPWRRTVLALAVVVCTARVYMGAHLPLDVIGGAGLGLLVGEGFRLIETQWANRRSADDAGSVMPSTGQH